MIDEAVGALFDLLLPPDPGRAPRRLWRGIRQTLGTELALVAVVGGVACGVALLVFGRQSLAAGFQWVVLPASLPVAWCVGRGRGLLRGLLAGTVSALSACTVVGAYLLFKVLEFFLTFGGSF